LLPGMLCFSATYPLTVYFSGKNQNKTTIFFLAIAILSLAADNIILTPKYFIYGAAISSSLSNGIFLFLMARKFLAQNKLPFSLKDFWMPFNVSAIFKAIVKI
jgi:O-antigen/teichoic acid export membrane protein